VLKIVSIVDDEDMTVVKNFRVGKEKHMNLNYSSTDVRWHPQASLSTSSPSSFLLITRKHSEDSNSSNKWSSGHLEYRREPTKAGSDLTKTQFSNNLP